MKSLIFDDKAFLSIDTPVVRRTPGKIFKPMNF